MLAFRRLNSLKQQQTEYSLLQIWTKALLKYMMTDQSTLIHIILLNKIKYQPVILNWIITTVFGKAVLMLVLHSICRLFSTVFSAVTVKTHHKLFPMFKSKFRVLIIGGQQITARLHLQLIQTPDLWIQKISKQLWYSN